MNLEIKRTRLYLEYGYKFARIILGTGLVMYGIRELRLVLNHDISKIQQFTNLLDEMGMGTIFLTVSLALVGYNNRRKDQAIKRLTEEKSRLQQEVEKEDESRSSSGLNSDGTTPDETEVEEDL